MIDQLKRSEELFSQGKQREAEFLLLSLLEQDADNAKAHNNFGVIVFLKGNVDTALYHFKKSLSLSPLNKDALLNYVDVLRSLNLIHQALPVLKKANKKYPDDQGLCQILHEAKLAKESQKKIAILCLPDLESFLEDIVSFLKTRYNVRTCYTKNDQEIESAVLWADLVWLEWANEMAVHVTRNIPTLSEKKVICRLHSYEAFADYPKQIEWNLITALIFVADHLKDITLELVPEVKKTSIHVIPNGINLDHWKFAKRKPGYEIAYVGAINYKKGSILLPHLFKAVYDQDPKYRFHLAGEFKDARYALYFKQMLYELGIKNNFRIYNKVDDVNAWLEDKNYIVSTSLLESQQLSLCEAMAKGIKPVIHNFVGARSLYPGEYIFNTMDEAVEMICSEEYDSEKYRGFVSERYNMKNQLQKIDALLQNITNCKQNESNYN